MYRKLTYIKHEYELELFKIEEFDSNKNLIYNKIVHPDEVLETKITYDKSGNVILEENFIDGKMSDCSVSEFNENNEPISISVIIQDELYEKTEFIKTEKEEISVSMVEGKESSKTITESNENNSISTEYEYGDFVKKTVSIDTENGRKDTIYNENGEITFYENFEFDENDNILKHEVFNHILEPVSKEIHTYKNGNLISINYESIEEYQYYTYEYDSNNNLIDYKVLDRKNNVLGFEKAIFDDKNRKIETISYSMGFQPIHYEIKYEDLN